MSELLNLIEFLERQYPLSGSGEETPFSQAINELKKIISKIEPEKINPSLEKIATQLLEMDQDIFKDGSSLFVLGNPLAQLQIYTILAFLKDANISEECSDKIKTLTDLFTKKIEEINKTLNPDL